jgi:hypothetical protein
MPGVSISRWTMSYFAASLAFLLVGLALMAGGFGFPSAPVEAPDTLVVVHILTIGWLGLLFCGALLQFVPVLVASPLRMAFLAAPALILILAGLLSLLAGFLELGGHVEMALPALPLGAALLLLGFGALIAAVVATLLSQRPLNLSARLVALGAMALALTIIMGSLFAGTLSGLVDAPFFDEFLSAGVPFHAAFGLLGWMTLTAVGVSYRLFTMFMLAPEGENTFGRLVVAAALAGLAVLMLALILAVAQMSAAPYASGCAALIAAVAASLYFRDLSGMYRARRRKQLELNSVASLVAAFFLAVGLTALLLAQAADDPEHYAAPALYLLGLGWLTGLGLAQLYKIIPFLTWLERYGPVMGKAPVPRVQDLVDERRARLWFVLFYAAVAMGFIFLITEAPTLFRMATLFQGVAVFGLVLEYWKARRLSYAPKGSQHQAGSVRQRLIFPSTHIKE